MPLWLCIILGLVLAIAYKVYKNFKAKKEIEKINKLVVEDKNKDVNNKVDIEK